MSCGAKFPVYVLISGAFFSPDDAGNVLFGIYLLGVVIALISAKFLKTTVFKGMSEPFVMELPPYRLPMLKTLLFQSWQKAALYLKKAGTIILFASVLIWVASNYPKSEEISEKYEIKISEMENNLNVSDNEKEKIISELKRAEQTELIEHSFVGIIGKGIEPVVAPMGFDWRLGIALATGIAAKEVVVSTLGTLFSLGDADENSGALRDRLRANPDYNVAVALSLMVFVLLYIPCFAASIVFHREAGRWKWTILYIGYTMTVAWIVSFIVYRIALVFV